MTDGKNPPIILRESDMPRTIVLLRDNDQPKVYQLTFGARSGGLSLQGVSEYVRRSVLKFMGPFRL